MIRIELIFIRERGIKLIYVPIENSDTDELFFSAVYVCIKEEDCKTKFIGLNTNDYYDNQIFALGHELYHYYEESSVHLCRVSDEYYIIGLSINSEIFKLLNSKTMKKGVGGSDLETVVRNYEDGIIALSDFIESLEMFDKKIHDFGVVEDIAEMEEMFGVEE